MQSGVLVEFGRTIEFILTNFVHLLSVILRKTAQLILYKRYVNQELYGTERSFYLASANLPVVQNL